MNAMRLAALATVGLTMACADETPAPERVTPTAEALESGTCMDACGGASADGCYCDPACESWGDCCPDYQEVCQSPELPQGECYQDSDCEAAERCDLMEVVAPGGDGFMVIGSCVPNGECAQDGDCDDGQACIINTICAECSFDTPNCPCTEVGTCMDKPDSECLQDSDCGAAERCELMEIVNPNGGFSVIGRCEPNGECSTDSDCGDSQACVIETICAACSLDTPNCPCTEVGSCQNAPQSECYEDGDCDAGERCDLMEVVNPGGGGFSVIGTCIAAAGACEGYCGGQSPEGCWCDSTCETYGDCCADKPATCG